MKYQYRRMLVVLSILLALLFSAVGTIPVRAWGPFSHTELVRLALDLVPPSDLKTLLQTYQGSVMAGSVFPDWGMAYALLPGKDADKFNNLAEYAHWSEFITAYLDYVRQNYHPPYDEQESKSIAFLFGIIAHNVGDPFFHDHLLPWVQVNEIQIWGVPGHQDVEFGVDVFNIYREPWCVVIPGGTGCAYEYLFVDWYLPVDPIMAAYAELFSNGVTWYELTDVNDLTLGWSTYQTASTAQIAAESTIATYDYYSVVRLPITHGIFQTLEPGGDFDAADHISGAWLATWAILDYTGVYHVKPTTSGSGDCKSWGNACTLQSALSIPYGSNQVWVMGGEYKPTGGSDRSVTFKLRYGLDMYGG
ncbi:hypothetical protein EG832_19015, partial [bacterium]|nr:hypothetical protein [bacterium]